MRMTSMFGIVCLAGVLAIATSASAQTDRNKPADAARPAQGETMAPAQKPANPAVPVRPVMAPGGLPLALTEAECIGIGGKIRDTSIDTCAGGKACYRADEVGVIYHKCLEKQ
jgi:hypothetical protein